MGAITIIRLARGRKSCFQTFYFENLRTPVVARRAGE